MDFFSGNIYWAWVRKCLLCAVLPLRYVHQHGEEVHDDSLSLSNISLFALSLSLPIFWSSIFFSSWLPCAIICLNNLGEFIFQFCVKFFPIYLKRKKLQKWRLRLQLRKTLFFFRRKGEISAYSVFNPGCEAIDGTLTAQQFENELRHKNR